MGDSAITGIKACVFDAYGMLFDVHSAIKRGGAPLGDSAQAVSDLWRLKQLEYAWNSDLLGRHKDFWQATAEALDYALAVHGVEDSQLRARLLDLYLTLEAYPDVVPCLEVLRARGVTNAILSNGTSRMLEAAVGSAGLDALMDAVLSIDEVGIYKPHKRAYQLAVDRLALPADRICFISTNGWDVAGAAVFGFRVVWHNRFGRPQDRLPGEPEAVITSLDELPGLLGG
jgi:2-haloacid dehalogenase